MEGQAIQPGSILAGRYRVDDLVGEAAGSTTWRAFDTILNRSVSIRAVGADDPRCPAFLDAARASTAVSDPRFLPVLDAVPDEDGVAYVVREWSRALPLSVILREGALPSRRAAAIVGEVAEALAVAHDVGMPHRAINPSTVLVKENGAVRITGLGTEHALRAAAPAPKPEAAGDVTADATARHAGEQVDVRALGRIFYSCLVARWPGGRGFGLPPAPTEHGRLLRPRQVRAGVSRSADHVCDRILGQPPRHHARPLTTAREIAGDLATVEDDDSMLSDVEITGDIGILPAAAGNGGPPGPPPALLPTRPRPAPPPRQLSRMERSRDLARQATEGHRKLIWLGVVLLGVLAVLIGVLVGRTTVGDNTASDGSGGHEAAAGAAVEPLDIDNAVSLDPVAAGGSGSENNELTSLAIDDKRNTAWQTMWYETSEFGNQKPGVGLILDLGRDREVTDLRIQFGASPTSYQIYTAQPGASDPSADVPTETGAWIRHGDPEQVDDTQSPSLYRLDTPVTTRYVLLWLTSLPPDDEGHYTGVVNEVAVEGSPS